MLLPAWWWVSSSNCLSTHRLPLFLAKWHPPVACLFLTEGGSPVAVSLRTWRREKPLITVSPRMQTTSELLPRTRGLLLWCMQARNGQFRIPNLRVIHPNNLTHNPTCTQTRGGETLSQVRLIKITSEAPPLDTFNIWQLFHLLPQESHVKTAKNRFQQQ